MVVLLVGNPNTGKTSLFNALTGRHSHVGNYPGVTVEAIEGTVHYQSGQEESFNFKLVDLPGIYSLSAHTPDETLTYRSLEGRHEQEAALILAVVDAQQLERSLGLVLELKTLGRPMVLAVNRFDLAEKKGLKLNTELLAAEMAMPVVACSALRAEGVGTLIKVLGETLQKPNQTNRLPKHLPSTYSAHFQEVDRLLKLTLEQKASPSSWVKKIINKVETKEIDEVVLHPFFGPLLFAGVLIFIFQAIFSWAELPMEFLKTCFEKFNFFLNSHLSPGPLTSLLTDALVSGVGSVLIFLPQILLLFAFLFLLEDCGYLPRGAFLLDQSMQRFGLQGRAFIPLLSSFACAVPGILATRTIESKRDRLITILIAPLMACSARLPVYTLIVATFIPNLPLFTIRTVGLQIRLPGFMLFCLYSSGLFVALFFSWLVHKVFPDSNEKTAFILELPNYKWPDWRGLLACLWEKATLFVSRAGSVILAGSVLIWFLCSYPKATPNSNEPPISKSRQMELSYAGNLGKFFEPCFRPIGFDWKMVVSLIPSFAARELLVGTLGTLYAVHSAETEQANLANSNSANGSNADRSSKDGVSGQQQLFLAERLAKEWSLASAMSLVVWFVFACQCLSTLAVIQKETQSLKWPLVVLFTLNSLAYASAWITYQTLHRLGY